MSLALAVYVNMVFAAGAAIAVIMRRPLAIGALLFTGESPKEFRCDVWESAQVRLDFLR